MTGLKDGDLQHSSALAQSPKGDIEPNHPSEINPNSDSRSRSDGRSRRYVQYRVDQSLGQRPRSLLSLNVTIQCIVCIVLNGKSISNQVFFQISNKGVFK